MYHNVSQYITFRLQTAMRFLRRTIANKVQSIDWQYVNRLLTSENLSNLSSFFHFQIFSNLSAFPTDFHRQGCKPVRDHAADDEEGLVPVATSDDTKRRRRLSEAQRWLAPRC